MPAGSPHIGGPRGRVSRFVPIPLLVLMVFAATLASGGTARAQGVAWVDTGGDCLVLRDAPGLGSNRLRCLDHGAELTLLEGAQALDGFTWQRVTFEGQPGWVADFYITVDPGEVQVLHEPAAPTSGGLIAPPVGGLTIGVTTEADPAALVAAQGYPVVGVWSLDVASQELRQYLPGAPAFVNTLDAIPSGGVVVLRRGGVLTAAGAPPAASLTVAGTPNRLVAPPVGGVTQGVSGTTDPRFLVEAQGFTVQSVAYFHVGSQQWLVYLPGAPDHVQSLQQGQLRVDSVVSVRRGADDPNRPPASEGPSGEPAGEAPSGEAPAGEEPGGAPSVVGVPFETSITYYYCVPGSNPASIGDGGGYCGGMANGQVVHDGAAACAADKLGQRFTIEGDPTGRVYTCEDTGGAVLNDHRDIWFMHSDEGYAWWVQVGSRARITVLAD